MRPITCRAGDENVGSVVCHWRSNSRKARVKRAGNVYGMSWLPGMARTGRSSEWRNAEARASLDRAEEERPATAGKLNGEDFQDFRDYDDRLGGVIELIVKDKYVWLPIEQIRHLEISPPKQLRDMLWANARVEALDGTEIGRAHV